MQKPTSDEARDYRWRLSVSKDDWVTLAGILAAAVDYSNFRTVKRQRAAEAPELFAAYRTLAADARSVVSVQLWRRRMTNVLLPSDLPVSSSALS